MNFAPWPCFDNDEIEAAVKVLQSGKVNQWTGEQITGFEKEFAAYIGADYSVALANGSLALDSILRVSGIKKGDEVIVTPRSFVASAGCVLLRQAVPVFVDVDPVSQNITLENIIKGVSPKTRAVIAVNLAGWPCELDKISEYCRQNNILFIEDCAQAHGAAFRGKKAGSYGDCAVFSFCQDKIMTTGGEGGMLVTNNKELWEKVWSYKDHGKDYRQSLEADHPQGFKWLVTGLGTNCRMTEMQAAMGRVMLKKLDRWVEQRREFAGLFNQAFKTVPGLRITVPDEHTYHSYYKYYVFIEPDAVKAEWDRTRILNVLNEAGVPCNTGICPEIYLEELFKNYVYKIRAAGLRSGTTRLPAAKQLGETSMMFMVHPTLTKASIQFVIDQVIKVMKKAVR